MRKCQLGKCQQNAMKLSRELFKKSPESFQKVSRKFPESFQRLFRNFSETFQKLFRNFTKNFQKLYRNFSETFQKHFRNVSNRLFSKRIWTIHGVGQFSGRRSGNATKRCFQTLVFQIFVCMRSFFKR